jgi:hypothetical protein
MITIFLMETYPAGQMTLWLKSIMLPDGSPKYSRALINSELLNSSPDSCGLHAASSADVSPSSRVRHPDRYLRNHRRHDFPYGSARWYL